MQRLKEREGWEERILRPRLQWKNIVDLTSFDLTKIHRSWLFVWQYRREAQTFKY